MHRRKSDRKTSRVKGKPMQTCYVCGVPTAKNRETPCPDCQTKMLAGIFFIPVSDSVHVRLPGRPILCDEQTVRKVFANTPALKVMLASRAVRMPVSVFVSSGLPSA